ncbi:MAG TPA: transporter [Polyangia bacterium]
MIAEHGLAAIMPRTAAGVDWTGATFDLGDRKGRWQLITPSFEWRVFERLSLFAALPFGRVDLDDSAGGGYGLGDLSVSGKATLVATPHGGFLLSAGLGAELPTGDADNGFGGGHVELIPFVAASSAFYEGGRLALVAYGMAALRGSVGADHPEDEHGAGTVSHVHGPAAGSVVAPHAEREGYARAMLAAVLGSFDVGTGGEGAVVFAGKGPGHLGWRAEAGYLLNESVRLHTAVDLGLLGERRYGVRGRLGAAWLF